MQLENLRQNYPKLLTRIEDDGYSAAYTARMRSMINSILTEADIRGWNDYDDVRRYFETIPIALDTLTKKRTLIGAIMEFDLNGKYPDRTTPDLVKRGAYHKLLPSFMIVIDNFKASERARGKKESSINTEASTASSFLLRMQEAGADSLEDITEEMVVMMFAMPSNGPRMSCSLSNCITSVIRSYAPIDPLSCQNILTSIPTVKRSKKIIQYIRDNEERALLSAFSDMSNGLCLRDRAIGILAYYTGMRGSDIMDLNLSSIDWEGDVIYVKQRKTGAPLDIPLRAPVGNAIFDYITEERPNANCQALFLAKNKPYRRLRSIYQVAQAVMTAAGIRQSSSERGGLHLFRHHMATSLMGSGIPRVIISDAIGHTDPDSLVSYLSADTANLRNCALSIEQFPIGREVFINA